jgi:ribosomal protein L29
MAILRKKEIENMNTQELENRLKDLKLELLKANAQRASKTGANTKIREIKKTIARILTKISKQKIRKEKK